MKAIKDRVGALDAGLAAIRDQFHLPAAFPPEILDAAEEAARNPLHGLIDRTGVVFQTLDPASSTDLDQAFSIEPSGTDLLLHYAIADVGSFVRPGGVIDREAWERGETIYLPNGKVRLYPEVLSEGAASLLPGADKAAIVFTVRVMPDGEVLLDSAERALIRSKAKLGYATVRHEDLPAGFAELSRRIAAAELRRGAARIDPPQQELKKVDGGYVLDFRPMSEIEQDNAAMSLAANLAIAKCLHAHGTGLFRTMAEPGRRAIKRLRHSATAFGIEWPSTMSLEERERTLDPLDRRHAAFMLAIRRAGREAGYSPFQEGVTAWHSAVAATYVHATAPLRRLADRYVIEAALAVANGREVDPEIQQAFEPLAEVMTKADAKAAQVDSSVIELAESVVLADQVGTTFEGCVTDFDQRGARIQLCELPVITRVADEGLTLGDTVLVRLIEADPARRLTRFERA